MKNVDQNKFFLLIMMMVSLMLASMAAKAETDLETTCRAKAKEVAVQAYQGCMTDNRTAKINEIREDYKKAKADLEAKYQHDMKALGGADEKSAAAPNAKAPRSPAPRKVVKSPRKPKASRPAPRAEEPVEGIAQRLPPKRNKNGPALPIQNVSDDQPVVAAASNDDIPVVVPVTETPTEEPTSGEDASF